MKEDSLVERPIEHIDLFLTEKCNLSCKYCFHVNDSNSTLEKTPDLTVAQGKKILDRMKELFPKKMGITFFGGEPMLFPEVMLELARHAKSLWNDVHMVTSTNGTVFDEAVFVEMEKLGVYPQISFDGAEYTQNLGRGKFELISENVKKILKIFPMATIRMTYTPETVGFLMENVKFVHDMGAIKIMHHATMESNWTSEAIEEYKHQLANMYHYRRYCRKAGIPLEIRFIDKCLQVIDDEIQPEVDFCGAGKSYVAVMSTGDVYSCHRAASNKIFKLGNIFNEKNQIVRGIFLGIDKKTVGCMKSCRASKICHTCTLTHYTVNNDFMRPLNRSGYCDVCRAEYDFGMSYLPTERSDRQGRLLASMGSVLADMSDMMARYNKPDNATK